MSFIYRSIVFITALWLTACSDTEELNRVKQDGFVYCGQGNPSSFNPQLVDNDIAAEALAPQIFDSLLTIDPITYEPKPNIAKSWSVNPAGTLFTFNLRDDIRFQHTAWFTPSRNLNAKDVVFSFNRILDSAHPFHYVGNAEYPWFSAIGFADNIKSVSIGSPTEVIFELHQPDNTFLSNIATSYAAIHSFEYGQQLILADEKNQIDNLPVGSGPFFLDEFKNGDYIRLKRNTQYWKEVPIMKQVVFDISMRGTGTLAKLLRNECDVLYSPLSSQLPVITEHSHLSLESMPAMNVSFVAIKTNHPALNDKRVRKALNLAVNRQNIIDSVYYGAGKPAYTLLPPSSWAYHKDSIQVRYDQSYAKALLREAGFTNGLELNMLVPVEPRSYNPSPRKVAELLQANYAAVGVKLNIIIDERFNRSGSADHSEANLVLTGWNADTGHPDNFFRPLLSCSAHSMGLNVSTWCDVDFDFLIDLAKETNELRYRKNLYDQVQNLINEEVPIIPLAHGVQFQAKHRSIEGLKVSPFNTLAFDQVKRLN